jgi:hypothetical protein
LYLEALGTNQNIRVVPSGTGVFTTASPVTFTNSTAGSAGAGALVVTGGLSAGNNGNASYFGGAATFAGAVTVSGTGQSTFGTGSNTVEITPSAAGRVNIKKEAGSDAYLELAGNGNTVGSSSLVIGQSGGDLGVIYNRKNAALSFGTNGTERLSISAAGAATFAGTVIAPAATASLAPLRIPHGTAPTSPTNGDMWSTDAGLFIRINGATVGPLS